MSNYVAVRGLSVDHTEAILWMRPSEARQLEGCANWGGLAEKSVAMGSFDSGKESSSQRFLEFGTKGAINIAGEFLLHKLIDVCTTFV